MQSKFLRPLAALLIAMATAPLVAQEPPAELSPVITTATRTPIALADATLPVLVISRADIERSQASDLAELLRFHAGIELGRNGGPGQNTSLFLRGTESNHTLVLVDGVEMNPGTLGGAAIHNLRPDIIERIEVVKGPRSALWGSEAIGGVVNIITRAADHGFDWSLSVGAGRYDTRSAGFETRVRGERGGLAVGFSNLDSAGFPTRSDATIDRAHDNTTVNLKADTRLGQAMVTARYWEARGNTEYLDFFLAPLEQDFVNSIIATDVSFTPRQDWHTTLGLSQSKDEIFQLDGSDYVITRRTTVDWQNTLTSSKRHTLLAGLTVSEEDTESLSFGAFFADSSRVTEIYVSDYLDLGRHGLLLAARHTEHDAFSSAQTWNAEYSLKLSGSARLTAGLGTAYRAPDGTDRFGFGGNPNLRPERARNAELGLRRDLGNARLSISLFQNDIDDLVEFVFDPETFDGGNINVGRARIRGLDASYELVTDNWHWRIATIFQKPENAANGSLLARRARRSLSTSLVRALGWGELGIDLLASAERRDSPFSDTINAGYLLANLTARVDLASQLALRLKLENLLDSDYETAAGFRNAGRSLYVGLSYSGR